MKVERLEKRRDVLLKEIQALELRHQQLLETFKQQVSANQSRHNQIRGAVLELNKLISELKGKSNEKSPRSNDNRNGAGVLREHEHHSMAHSPSRRNAPIRRPRRAAGRRSDPPAAASL